MKSIARKPKVPSMPTMCIADRLCFLSSFSSTTIWHAATSWPSRMKQMPRMTRPVDSGLSKPCELDSSDSDADTDSDSDSDATAAWWSAASR